MRAMSAKKSAPRFSSTSRMRAATSPSAVSASSRGATRARRGRARRARRSARRARRPPTRRARARDERVEIARLEPVDARREHLRLRAPTRGSGQPSSCATTSRVIAIAAAARARDEAVPVEEETPIRRARRPARPPCEASRALFCGARRAPRRRNTRCPVRSGSERARHDAPACTSVSSALAMRASAKPEARARRASPERPCVRAKRATRIDERVVHFSEERVRQPARRRDAERVAVARRVFDRDEARLAGDADCARRDDRARARRAIRARFVGSVRAAISRSRDRRPRGARRGARRRGSRGESRRWRRLLVRREHLFVEQLPELRLAEQLAELRVIDR